MTIVGITGSIASGKTTVANLMAGKKYPLFSADEIKKQIKLILKKNKNNLNKLESVIHPFVKKEMRNFLKKKKKLIFLEIPLLLESKLNNYFDKLIFVGANKNLRLERYLKKQGDKKIFILLDKRQLSKKKKKNICDYTINNNYSLAILKRNVKNFIKKYE